MAYVSESPLFMSLSDKEEPAIREYARRNDPSNTRTWECFHPVCREEWAKRGLRPEEEPS